LLTLFNFLDLAQKKMKKLQLVLISLGFAISASSFAQVAIGSPVTEEPSAILELESNQKGFLLPRMTNQQRRDIPSPAAGLQVYVTDFEEDKEKKGKGVIMFYNGSKWKALTKLITCPSAPTNVQASVVTDTSGEVEITFTPPSENGGSDIISYKVTPSLGGVTPISAQEFTAEEFNQNNKIRVTSLAIGESYTFTITATNAIDTSLPSEVSDSVELTPKVGDFYQGGVVFYLLKEGDKDVDGYDSGKTQGLICALEDLEGSYKWSPDGVTQEVTGTLENMGRGKSNTDKIIAKLGVDNKDYAAYQARTYQYGGYNDWYLPSKDELNRIYENLKNYSNMQFKDAYYWSSSEKGTDDACQHNLVDNGQGQVLKSNTYLVRPVRSFL
jgi:hypothetical protein